MTPTDRVRAWIAGCQRRGFTAPMIAQDTGILRPVVQRALSHLRAQGELVVVAALPAGRYEKPVNVWAVPRAGKKQAGMSGRGRSRPA